MQLAASGLRMPIGADIILHQQPDPEAVLLDGERLGRMFADTAVRFKTPLAMVRMDLELERNLLLRSLGIREDEIPKFHFSGGPSEGIRSIIESGFKAQLTPRLKAQLDAIRYVSGCPGLFPVGMSIGPFSLMTKLLADPISAVAMAGSGLVAEDDPEVNLMEKLLQVCSEILQVTIGAQLEAGAKAVLIAEPAANKVFLSPRQISKGSDIFERYVLEYHRRIKNLIEGHDALYMLHDCGELTDYMVEKLAGLKPALLSLGSSRPLWEVEPMVPKDVVLFGNLPSKQFFSDNIITVEQVKQTACEIITRMKALDHPFILGSECDVIMVPGREREITEKVQAFMEVVCG